MPSLILPIAKPKGKPARVSPFWHIRYYCPLLRRSRVISTMCRKRKNAESRLREFCDLLERGKITKANPFILQREAHRAEALSDKLTVESCLATFENDLRAGRVRKRGRRRAVQSDHGDTTMARVRKILEGCGIETVDQLTVDGVNAFLDRCQSDKVIKTAQTRKHYERAIKSFSKWCQISERLDRDPLLRLDVTFVDAERDTVHERSEFTMEQVNLLIGAAYHGDKYGGLSGFQRAMLYAFAASTGFRARECAAVRHSDFDEGFRFVNLSGMFTKNRKKAKIPIPTALGQALVFYAAKLSGDEFLFPGGWEKPGEDWVNAGWIKDHRASDFLRFDAADTGIVIGRKGKAANGGKVLDFHSFRHTYISNLERAGVSDGMKEKLSRATAGVLERYTHHDLARFSETSDRMVVPNVSMFENAGKGSPKSK